MNWKAKGLPRRLNPVWRGLQGVSFLMTHKRFAHRGFETLHNLRPLHNAFALLSGQRFGRQSAAGRWREGLNFRPAVRLSTLTTSCKTLVWGLLIGACLLGGIGFLSPGAALAQPAEKPSAQYLIGPGDVLEILVWREPDISRTVRVRPDGKISLPLVDDIQAAKSTLPQLKARITKALAAFVDNPSVYVMLQENRSKRIYVVGMVTTPGEYVLEKDLTVLQAVAMAGGFTEWAKKDEIVILRRGPKTQSRIEFDYNRVVSGKDIEQNILLKPDDVIVVP